MKISQYEGKKVIITDIDEEVHYGKVTDYIYPEDNEPEGESIILENLEGELLEFRPEDIKKIETVE